MTNVQTVIAINCQNPVEVRRFDNVAQARAIGNGFAIIRNPEELATTQAVPTAALVTLYNNFNPDKPVKRFSDRNAASQRVWDTINDKVEVEKGLNMTQVNEAVKQAAAAKPTAEDKAKAKAEAKAAKEKAKADAKAAKDAEKAKKAEEKAAAKAAGGDKTRKSKFAGKLLKHSIAKDAEGTVKNPRRAGSHGYNSLAHIIKAGDKGILTEDYLKAGGRMNDLHWDVDHGNVTFQDPPKAENTTA